MFHSVYSVSLCCSLYCFMWMCTVLLPPGVNPIAVNKYIISCHSIVVVRFPCSRTHFPHIVFSASTYRRAKHIWSRGNAHDMYSEGTRFESHQGHRVSWDTLWFPLVPRHVLGSYVHSVRHTTFRWIFIFPFPIVLSNLFLWVVFKCYGFIIWLSLVISGECRDLFDPLTLFQIDLSLTELLCRMSCHRNLCARNLGAEAGWPYRSLYCFPEKTLGKYLLTVAASFWILNQLKIIPIFYAT